MALDQIGFGRDLVLIASSIALGAVMLGMAIAFGLGLRDAAKLLIEKELFRPGEKRRSGGGLASAASGRLFRERGTEGRVAWGLAARV